VTAPIGVLVMAYGTASGPDDIERYYTDIRGGRRPAPELLAELKERYGAIGNVFPLLDTTTRQALGLERELNAGGPHAFKTYLGMKHSAPFIEEGVGEMRRDGIERGVGIVMAPHWSAMSTDTYLARVRAAVADGGGPAFTFVRSFHDHPSFIDLLALRVAHGIARLPAGARERPVVVFSAHSLPIRTLEDGSERCLRCDECESSCRYRDALQETADLVAERLDLEAHSIAWQSAGRTADPWWGPPIEEMIGDLAAKGYTGVVVCSAGFVADHLETLYDLDIEVRAIAESSGIAFSRTEMPNADPVFTKMLADVVREHLESGSAR
jgi:ferrochelatase